MRLPFISRRRAQAKVDLAASGFRVLLDKADEQLMKALTAQYRAEAELREFKRREESPMEVEHTELWSLIDWSLWGSGMGDTFRERLADQFIAGLTPEQHEQALRLIQAWTDIGREPLGRRRYEDQQRRLHRAVRAVAYEREQAEGYRRTIKHLTDRLLDATGNQGEPLLDAARKALDIEVKEDAA
ncbi:hypothetical protein ACWD5B_28985 [Streptomyces tanashiensis]